MLIKFKINLKLIYLKEMIKIVPQLTLEGKINKLKQKEKIIKVLVKIVFRKNK